MDQIGNSRERHEFDGNYGNSNIISGRMFNLIIGACLLWGFFCNAIMVTYFSEWALSLNIIVVCSQLFIGNYDI